jgi:hypothetical protein
MDISLENYQTEQTIVMKMQQQPIKQPLKPLQTNQDMVSLSHLLVIG